MQILEKTWEALGVVFGGSLRGFERSLTSLFGSSNARYVKKLQPKVDAINALEPKYKELSDEELRLVSDKFRKRLLAGETLDDILVEAFAACREAGRRYLGMRHYDVQLIGGMVLHSGAIAEMVTGEGKTLVATLPAYLNALEGRGVHVVTVNDYLARRDMEWMSRVYRGLGLTVGAIQSDMSAGERQKAYACDITYGTNNEFGFDYLRDNMRQAARGDDRFPKNLQQAQGRLNYAIIDEVDNILIDEARTPLIISGPANQHPAKYKEADRIAASLKKEIHFTVNEKDHAVTLTDQGVREAEKMAGVESFYTVGNMEWPHMIDNALKAHYLYKRDVNYVVQEDKVIIVDEFTGRLMDGRQWSDGLHQAVEAKENVPIKEETQTLATITLQNYFKLYRKISGMTGTGMTEAQEFWKIYKLDVIAIPTNRKMQRIEFPDSIYSTERAKFEAIAGEIERVHRWDILKLKDGAEIVGEVTSESDSAYTIVKRGEKEKSTVAKDLVTKAERKGRPVLVGTVSIEKSERLSELLDRKGIRHQVLNAKHHRREAEIVAQAGRIGAVTIATNMAGRGTDIIMGGNAETMAWAMLQDKYETRLDVPPEEWEALIKEIETRENMKAEGQFVKSIGGLHVIGTERHEARRIDLQLRGRCGRQGDPGSSRFFLSLEDDIMRIFAGPWVKKFLESMGWKEGEAIESRMVSRRIEAAQKKVEERHFDIRKNLLEYDEVMDEQRKRVYEFRQRILDGVNCRGVVEEMIEEQISNALSTYLSPTFGAESFAHFASGLLATQLDGKSFRGSDYNSAVMVAKDEAERTAETEVLSELEKNLPDGDEEAQEDWNWGAMLDFLNRRWNLGLKERDLKAIPRDQMSEILLEKARESIQKIDLSEGKKFFEGDVGVQSAIAWCEGRFGLKIAAAELDGLEMKEAIKYVLNKAVETYDKRESDYPVLAGFSNFSRKEGPNSIRIDRDGMLQWASNRFDVDIDPQEVESWNFDGLRDAMLKWSNARQASAKKAMDEIEKKVDAFIAKNNLPLREVTPALTKFAEDLHHSFDHELPTARLILLEDDEFKSGILSSFADYYHPEIRRMERFVLLEVVDSTWKDHLLAMDYLKAAVSQRGMASLDPKVEYKREGMRMFDDLWKNVGERVTELIFRMESLDDSFVSSTWVETSARHDAPVSTSDIAKQQQAAIDNSQQAAKAEPIRNRGPRVGRNDPCPCGSGKKYKHCHLRMDERSV